MTVLPNKNGITGIKARDWFVSALLGDKEGTRLHWVATIEAPNKKVRLCCLYCGHTSYMQALLLAVEECGWCICCYQAVVADFLRWEVTFSIICGV